MARGRNRFEQNNWLPKGVYRVDSGKFKAIRWGDDQRLIHIGVFDSAWEASYYRTLQINEGKHHWIGLPHNHDQYFGFIYLITEGATGRMYAGKKQFYYWGGPVGGQKYTDPRSPLWDAKAWKRGEWEFYTGSSEELNENIAKNGIENYRFRVIALSRSKLDLHIAEVNYLLSLDVLNARTPDGSQYLYFNKNIAGMEFRPPYFPEVLEQERARDLEEIRNYYLKPQVCPRCSRVLGFRIGTCSCEERVEDYHHGFEDLSGV
jgi:hypothetical protein